MRLNYVIAGIITKRFPMHDWAFTKHDTANDTNIQV